MLVSTFEYFAIPQRFYAMITATQLDLNTAFVFHTDTTMADKYALVEFLSNQLT